MNQSEKKTILVKLQELTTIIQGITCKEETLFGQEEQQEIPAYSETIRNNLTPEATRRTRERIKDGSMTAEMIAFRLSKELGRTITKEGVVKVGKHIKAKPTYSAKQHVSRYSAESASTIINLYRSFNQ